MQNIIVGRYESCSDYQGWIEPDDKSWIAFIAKDGRPEVFLNREPSGAVIGPCHALA